jgi:hypothetical protein
MEHLGISDLAGRMMDEDSWHHVEAITSELKEELGDVALTLDLVC